MVSLRLRILRLQNATCGNSHTSSHGKRASYLEPRIFIQGLLTRFLSLGHVSVLFNQFLQTLQSLLFPSEWYE